MKLSRMKTEALYRDIHTPLAELRIKLKAAGLSAGMDHEIAQVEHDIWRRQRATLKCEKPEGEK